MGCGWKGPKSQSLFWTRKNIWTIKCLSKSPKTFCLSFHKFLHLGKRCPMTEWHQPRCILGSLHAANISWTRPNNSAASAPGVNWSSASVPEPRCRSWFDPQKLPLDEWWRGEGRLQSVVHLPNQSIALATSLQQLQQQPHAMPGTFPNPLPKLASWELLPENLCAWYSNRF